MHQIALQLMPHSRTEPALNVKVHPRPVTVDDKLIEFFCLSCRIAEVD